MYRNHLYFLIGLSIILNGKKCDNFEESVQVLKNRNESDQSENVDIVSDLNPGIIADESITLDKIKNVENGQIMDRCFSENPLLRIKHKARRSTFLSRLRSRSKPAVLPNLAKFFKKQKIIPKYKRIKKQYPNYPIDQSENADKVSDLNPGIITEESINFDKIKNVDKRQIMDRCFSENPLSRMKRKARRSTFLSRLRSRCKPAMIPKSTFLEKRNIIPKYKRIKKEYPNYHYYSVLESDSSSEEDDQEPIRLGYFPMSRSRINTRRTCEEGDFENYGEEYDPNYKSQIVERENSNSKEIYDTLYNFGSELNSNLKKSDDDEIYYHNLNKDPAKVIRRKGSLESSNSEMLKKRKVEEGNSSGIKSIIKSVDSENESDLKKSDLETKGKDPLDSARTLIDRTDQLVNTLKLINQLLAEITSGDFFPRNQPIFSPKEGKEIIKEKNPLLEEKPHSDVVENMSAKKKTIPAVVENMPPQRKNFKTSINPVPKTDLNITEEDESDELWDFKSDNRNNKIIESAVRKTKKYFQKMIKELPEDNKKRNNYDTENKVVDVFSKMLKDVASSFSDSIPDAILFPGSSKREYENNFYDTTSNSGFDFVASHPEMCMCSACEEPLYIFYPDYGTSPKCNFGDNICLLRNNNESNDYQNNRRHKRKIQNGKSEGPDIILRPEHFFYDSNVYHIQDMRKNPRTASYLRDDNKLHNLNIYSNNRFINLDANCSTENDYNDPDCLRLDNHLRTPKGANSLPLRRVKDYLNDGLIIARHMHDRDRTLEAEGLHPRPNTPAMLQFLHNKATEKQVELNKESELTRIGTKIMQERLRDEYGISKSNFPDLLRHQGFRVKSKDICRKRRYDQCSTLGKYRNIDGSCNNVNYPTWGKSNTPFFRVLPPRYADGIHSLPVSVTGAELPNPRILSSELFSRNNRTEPIFTLAVMQWGQILAHDFAFQAMSQNVDGGVECCTPKGDPLPKRFQHHSCAPIIISSKDKFYSSFQRRCMNFVRSMTVPNEDCTLGAANQLNGATSFLDLSPLYGNDKDKSDSLRQFVGGRLKVEMRNGQRMMPTMRKRSVFCDVITPSDICYKTGDVRTNQNPQLIVLQTLLLREHNRIADVLSFINPHWKDETLFQESRRILIAMYQHITYKDWLPIVVGNQYCRNRNLVCLDPEMSYDYDYTVNPSTINSFTASAFRFLHSIVEGEIKLFTPMHDVSNTLRLSNHYFRPQIVERNSNFESLLRGLIYQPIQKPDACFNEEITEYLFRSKNEYGLDLEAIDIQRGRDHGIPGYNAYRKICHLEPAADFYDLINEISYNNIRKLRKKYAHVDDIDLLVGASLEIRIPGSFLGPTLRCLIGEQFYRSRVGDKYFYDNADFFHSFTPEQLLEIKKASLSRLICDSGGSISNLQLNSFRVQSQRNPPIPCEHLPPINLNMWREQPNEEEDLSEIE